MDKNQEASETSLGELDGRIARRVKALRLVGGFTIDGLAEQSGVSRAMISKIERGDVSPTAVLLGKLSNALGVTLSQLFRDKDDEGMLVRAASRMIWRDPATGYVRRNVSPVSSPVDLVEVTLPAGAQVAHDNAVPLNLTQLVWVFSGELTMQVDGQTHTLGAGDCLQMRLDQPISFQNQTTHEVRYSVILVRGGSR